MTLPYDYMPVVMEAIELIAQGYTETRACDECRLSISTFKHYIGKDSDLQDLYQEALQRGHDAMADALLSPDNHELYGHTDSKMAKVQSDNIKWFLEKRDPKRFGQRVQVDHHISADKAITQALLAARNRTTQLTVEHLQVLDADFTETRDPVEEARLLEEMGLA